MKERNLIVDMTFAFSIDIIEFAELLESNRKYVIARQLLSSGTAIGANVRESQNAESRIDFIHKMKVAAKEAEETEYWLLLCRHAKSYPDPPGLIEGLKDIIKVINKIIGTSKRS